MKLHTWRNQTLYESSKENKVNTKVRFLSSVSTMMELVILVQNAHIKKIMTILKMLASMEMTSIKARLSTYRETNTIRRG